MVALIEGDGKFKHKIEIPKPIDPFYEEPKKDTKPPV